MAFSERRMRRYNTRVPKLSPWLLLGICVGAALLATVVIGNILTLTLDDETYRRLTEGKTTETEATGGVETPVPDIQAEPFRLGASVEELDDRAHVSVLLNNPQGVLQYDSPVAQYQGMQGNAEVPLLDKMSELSVFASYISGVFYPQAFAQEDSDIRYAVGAEEAVLLREFLRSGGAEVVLLNLPLNGEQLSAVTEYLRTVKAVVGDAAVGVAVPCETVLGTDGGKILETLLTVCDFCALDASKLSVGDVSGKTEEIRAEMLADAQKLMVPYDYYLRQYDMRLLMRPQQTALQESLDALDVRNYQIVDG